jgi:hypothetical protein
MVFVRSICIYIYVLLLTLGFQVSEVLTYSPLVGCGRIELMRVHEFGGEERKTSRSVIID